MVLLVQTVQLIIRIVGASSKSPLACSVPACLVSRTETVYFATLLTFILIAFRTLYTFCRYGRQKPWTPEKTTSQGKTSESSARNRFNFLSKRKFLSSIQASGFDVEPDIERVYQQNLDGIETTRGGRQASVGTSLTATETRSTSNKKRPYESD